MTKHIYIYSFLLLISQSCMLNNENKVEKKDKKTTISKKNIKVTDTIVIDYDTSKWNEITSNTIELDLKYATNDNFVKRVLYDCPRCFLRPKVAKSLISINNQLKKQGLKLKLYDCYRPKPIQQKLWDIVPDARYVTPPQKGSMHNRGLAVDITLIDNNGKELDMGTEFDYFGFKAYHTNNTLPEIILNNRKILKDIMQKNGFKAIRTEWWHYSYLNLNAPISDWEWHCK